MLKKYLKRMFDTNKQGDATEQSFYSCLSEMLEEFSKQKGRSLKITTLPKRTEAGNPDFRVWDGSQHIVGYIEAKAPTVENLSYIEDTEQLKRYRATFPNLILTNFFEFRLYRNGELVEGPVSIGRRYVMYEMETVPPAEKEEKFLNLLEKFFSFSLPRICEAETLAKELAKRTRFLRDEVIAQELEEEEKDKRGEISGFYEAFRTYLLSELSKRDFADLYSQTITYGLFAARTRSHDGFNRKLAYDYIPKTVGILKDVFNFVSLGNLPKQMEWIVDDISDVLAVTDVYKLLDEYFHKHRGKDPIVHFYETFLAEYDPETREKRGVYYTPEPVVSYIVRSLDEILKSRFGKTDGFADRTVTVLDPAAGTLTFLAEAAKLAIGEFTSRYGEGGRENFIKEHILKNFYAFELMMAPYAVGHLKMSFLLEELGYKLKDDDRFKLYLTNTLEMEELADTNLPGMSSLSEESHLAGEVKRDQPILVILGNPPYSVSSANKSDFIEKEMKLYKEDVCEERNIQPLSDDYIKFIRFAHWKIDKNKKGVIGMITNNSYISGLIHRGMRKKILQSFNEIYILNLHGNSRIGEKCPDKSKDENVFDIKQGVCISLFIKKGRQKGYGDVFYYDLYGLREKKYEYLKEHYIKSTKWKRVNPLEKDFLFTETNSSERYKEFMSVKEIFGTFSSGVKTHRDHFVVAFSEEEIRQRIQTFTSNLPDNIVAQALDLRDTRDWKVKTARENLKTIEWVNYVKDYSYRPFDIRKLCYSTALIDRGCDRWSLMKNFFRENIGLVTTRRMPEIFGAPAFVCNNVGDIHLISDQNYFFPLYIYEAGKEKSKESFKKSFLLFDPRTEYVVKTSNLSSDLMKKLSVTFKNKVTPEQIFHYVYAVLYSNTYRETYSEDLKRDFPRIPFTRDYNLFKKMASYGKKLTNLHLLKDDELTETSAKFEGKGENKVEKVRYEDQKVYINKEKYFEPVPLNIWEYQIGGYQVCEKWLKDRKDRNLSLEDISCYCRIVTSIEKTIRVQKEIDGIYDKIEESV